MCRGGASRGGSFIQIGSGSTLTPSESKAWAEGTGGPGLTNAARMYVDIMENPSRHTMQTTTVKNVLRRNYMKELADLRSEEKAKQLARKMGIQ